MDSKALKRPRARWIILAILAAIAAFPTAFCLELWISSGAILKRERDRVEAGLARLRAERIERPSLFEPETEGNSWDLLKVALPFWKNSHIDPDRKQFYRDEKGSPRGAAADLDRILVTLQPRMEELRQALRRRYVEPGHDYTPGVGVPGLLDVQAVLSVMDGVATHLRKSGKHGESLDALLICLGLADHVRVKGFSISVAIAQVGDRYGLEGLKELLAWHELEPADLARLARALEILETSWPGPLEFYREQELHFRQSIIALADGGPSADEIRKYWPEAVPGWRHLYSDRILARQLLGIAEGHLVWLEGVTQRPYAEWHEASKSADLKIKKAMEGLWNHGGNWNWYLKQWGIVRMRLTLARLATALARYHADHAEYPATLEALSPKYLPRTPGDPWGGQPFGYWVKDGEATVVSRTRDPESADRALGRGLGPEEDGFPAWRVRRK